MGLDEWSLIGVNAAAAALLLNSGIAKIVSPDPLRRALTEVISAFESANAPALLRGLAAIEIAAAVAVLVGPARMPASAVASLLGAGFALFGVLGLLRGGGAPCGCFGASGQEPLGWTNVVLGALLAAVYPVNAATGVRLESATDYTAGALLLASMASLVLCVHTHRRLVRRHLPIGPHGSKPTLTVGKEAH
ncbi:MauE/DoxX family redox-associated membrane protein [Actinomadura sp. HBU206391]|uniref:MauE/DoxX family redox-associated membrane protein n=1 Tax=Actinomadura sp. HBU206391 TaxID=2731692 RepID=UPI00164F70B0|nr:MauE/DoxX family redox-associated membrane protein [Actinomadura sp. HBU206391]MBC6460707.1 hypothetical protein [Actinomadura sp. HBU206391]